MDDIYLKDVIVRGVDIPLKKPIVSHLGKFETWPYICVDLITNCDIVGKSYIGPYLKEYIPSIASCIKVLAKKYEGNRIEPYNFFEESFKSLSLVGFKGVALYALAALDIAIWDTFSKSAKKPFAEFLGGSIKEPIKAYNSSGLWLIELNKISKEAENLKNEGNFNALKLRIGRQSYKEDIKALNEVQNGAGSDTIIMSDFNQCYSTIDAIKRCHNLDELGFYWFEEPIQYNLYSEIKKICDQIKTPIILGENFHGPDDAFEAINKKACDMIMPDLMRIGGISGWLKTATIADAFKINVSTHLYPEVSAHLLCLTPTAEWLEWVDWANPILKEPYEILNGNIIIPDKPGFGLEWEESTLSKFAIKI